MAVANTLTVYAIRNVGLSLAFPLWNMNGLIGLLWGVVFFKELRGASRARAGAVVGGSIVCALRLRSWRAQHHAAQPRSAVMRLVAFSRRSPQACCGGQCMSRIERPTSPG